MRPARARRRRAARGNGHRPGPSPAAGAAPMERESYARAYGRNRVVRELELLRSQPDVRVAPEAAREDAGRLDGRGLAEGTHHEERTQRETPAPAVAPGIVLRLACDLHDGEDGLPAGRVAGGEIALLHARAPGRRVRPQCGAVDAVGQEPPGRPANEKPVLQHRGFLTGREYARSIRPFAALAVAVPVLASGCGGSSHPQSAPPPPPSGSTTVAAPSPATTTQPLAGADTTPLSAAA